MAKDVIRELKSLISFLPLAIVSVLLVFLLVGSGVAGSGGLFQSPTSPLPISPIASPVAEREAVEVVGTPTPPPLIAVRTQPNYWLWVLGGLVLIGGVVGIMLYRRGGSDEG